MLAECCYSLGVVVKGIVEAAGRRAEAGYVGHGQKVQIFPLLT